MDGKAVHNERIWLLHRPQWEKVFLVYRSLLVTVVSSFILTTVSQPASERLGLHPVTMAIPH